ncbi:MAG: LuxR C-terminal-related transcriptional regulator [Candidatus Thiodiazotropha sp.]
MLNSSSINKQESLALAVSRIHRSRSLEELQKTFFATTPQFVKADAFGMYLLDEKHKTKELFSYKANQNFLAEYEDIRLHDPIFMRMLQKKSLTHSSEIFKDRDWRKQPLYKFLSKWGLDHTIEAPLIVGGQVIGTLNIARGGQHFRNDSLSFAQFICGEINTAYKHICEITELKREIASLRIPTDTMDSLSPRLQEVLELAITGAINRVIADRLGISENTVRHHLKHIYRQLDVHNRAELVQRVHSNRTKDIPN